MSKGREGGRLLKALQINLCLLLGLLIKYAILAELTRCLTTECVSLLGSLAWLIY